MRSFNEICRSKQHLGEVGVKSSRFLGGGPMDSIEM